MRFTRSVSPATLMLVVACAGSNDSRTSIGNPLRTGDAGGFVDPSDPSYSYDAGYGSGYTEIDSDGSVACMEYAVQTHQVTPQIFVVFDRSLSMVANGW